MKREKEREKESEGERVMWRTEKLRERGERKEKREIAKTKFSHGEKKVNRPLGKGRTNLSSLPSDLLQSGCYEKKAAFRDSSVKLVFSVATYDEKRHNVCDEKRHTFCVSMSVGNV